MVALLLLLTAVVRPWPGGEGIRSGTDSADFGIFGSISELHEEQLSREDDPDVQEAVQGILGGVKTRDRTFGSSGTGDLAEEYLSIPEALTRSPVIFDALSSDPIVNNTSVLDWMLPPPLSDQGTLNYVILVKSGDRTVWKLGSIVPRIGLFVDSGLDKWLYVDVDGDPSTGGPDGSDIRARMTFAKDLLARDWEASLFPPTLKFNNAGVKLEVEAVEPVDGSAGVGGSIYFIKGISYSGKNYIWSVGLELKEFADRLSIRVEAREWRAEPKLDLIRQLISGGSIDLGKINILEILGPFTVSYEFETPPERMDVHISVMRLQDRQLQDKAYVHLMLKADAFHTVLMAKGEVVLGVSNMGSPVESIEWKANDEGKPEDSIDLVMRYAEFSDDLVDAIIEISSLPGRLKIDLDYTQDSKGRNKTVMDLEAPGGIPYLKFLEVIYPGWGGSGNLSNWNATFVEVVDIPSPLHIETTASVPFDPEEDASPNLNVFDTFMKQIAGRFYRLGEIFREIPRAVSQMPSRKGSTLLDCRGGYIGCVRYVSTSGSFLNSSGDMISFLDAGGAPPAISALIHGVEYYRGAFDDSGNDITIRLRSAGSLDIFAVSDDRTAALNIDGLPRQLRIVTRGDEIAYEGSSDGNPARIDSIRYRYRGGGLRFDVDIDDIPSSLSMIRSGDQMEVRSGSGHIGSISMFTSDSASRPPLEIPESNFVSMVSGEDGTSVGLRLNRFSSFVYNNGTGGFIELDTVQEADFHAIIRDEMQELEMLAVFAPLPSHTHIDLPSVIGTPEISIPDFMDVESINDYADILLSLDAIGRAPITMASSVAEGLVKAIGRYSTGFSLTWDLAEQGSNLDMVISFRKQGRDRVPESRWTHGIWIEQKGAGENSSVDGKIFLQGMPTRGSVNLSFSDRTIRASLDFSHYSPEFDWLLIRTTGVQDRDISVYIREVPSGIDLFLDLMIYTDLSIGGRLIIDMDVHIVDVRGEAADLGSMIATLTKSSPILSIRQMYLPTVPSDISLHADIENGVEADYSASRSIEYLYFKITKRLEGRWSQVYAIFHDLPLSFYVNMTPNNDFSIQEPFITQGLPSLDVRTSGEGMDLFIEYDGSGFGQRGKFQIYADALRNTNTRYEGSDYVIDSEGIGFFSLEIDRLPVMDQFTLSSMSLLGMDIRHIRIATTMVYGIYPQIFLVDTRGGSFQFKLRGDITLGENTYSPDIFFITLRTTDVMGVGLPTGLFINKDTSAIDMGGSGGAVVMPAPVLTVWYMGAEALFGGGG